MSGMLIRVKSRIMKIRPMIVQYPDEFLNPDEDKTNRNMPIQKQISPR
jgi:hypothetical protein